MGETNNIEFIILRNDTKRSINYQYGIIVTTIEEN